MEVKQTINTYFNRMRDSFFTSMSDNEDAPMHEDARVPSKKTRGKSAGSVTSSQDEGIHSTGEKEEDDINEDDLADTNDEQDKNEETEQDDDEGRGSLEGDKIKDDISTDFADSEHGYIGDTEESIRKSPISEIMSPVVVDDNEDEKEEETKDEEDDNMDNASENDNKEESDDVDTQDQEESEIPKDEDEVGENFEEAETEDSPEETNEVEAEESEEQDAALLEKLIVDQPEEEEVETVAEEPKEEAAEDEPEPELAKLTEEPEDTVEAAAESQENTTETTVEEPVIAKIPGARKRKKKEIIDINKINANRKPISFRTTPLPMPVSSKKENKNIKPQFKSKSELQKQKTFKLKRKPLKLDKENKENEIPAIKLEDEGLTAKVDEVNKPKSQESKNKGRNPHMDHSLQRPKPPVNPLRLKTGNNEIKSPVIRKANLAGTEVWVPEEDKLYVYSYSSVPRVLYEKRMGSRRVLTTNLNEVELNNSLKIKFRNGRLIRGTNFGKNGMPQWDPYFAYARCLSRNDFQSIVEGSEMDSSFQNTPRFRRQSQRPSISVATQVSEGERSSQLTSRSPEVAIIKALVANTLREAAMEVAAEAEADRAKMESLAARRLSAFGIGEAQGEALIEVDANEETEEEKAEELAVEEMEEDGGEEEAEGDADDGGDAEAEEDGGGGDVEAEEEDGEGGGGDAEVEEEDGGEGEAKEEDAEAEDGSGEAGDDGDGDGKDKDDENKEGESKKGDDDD